MLYPPNGRFFMHISRSQAKRVLVSLLLILVWLSFITQGSHALLTANATLEGNTITTGTAELQISNSQAGSSTVYATARPGFNYSLSPGESESKYIILRNIGASSVPLDITVASNYSGQTSPASSGVKIDFMPVDSEGDSVGAIQSIGLTGAPRSLGVTIPPGGTQRIRITTSLDREVSSQAYSVVYNLIFYGTQHVAP